MQGQSSSQGEPKASNLKHATSAVGAHLDDETAIAALADQYFKDEGSPEGREQEYWMKAKEEVERQRRVPAAPAAPDQKSRPTEFDLQVEEAMHLDR